MKNLLKKFLTVFTVGAVALASFGLVPTAEAAKKAPKTIIVGTGNAFKPYCYLDAKGNATGYETAVLKEINKHLPQYKFVFEPQSFTNILVGLEAGKVDLAAHQYEKNPERQKKYLFSNETYTTFILRITVKKGRKDIKSLKDLEKKTVQVGQGSNDAYVLEQYNKAHNNAIKLSYVSTTDPALTVKAIKDGRIDAFISVKRIVDSYNKAYGNYLETVGTPIAASSTYYLFRKSDVKLRDDVDKVLKALKADGTLSKISIKVLGGDYTSND
jgi:L-cystine transport system substrate-binding protein